MFVLYLFLFVSIDGLEEVAWVQGIPHPAPFTQGRSSVILKSSSSREPPRPTRRHALVVSGKNEEIKKVS